MHFHCNSTAHICSVVYGWCVCQAYYLGLGLPLQHDSTLRMFGPLPLGVWFVAHCVVHPCQWSRILRWIKCTLSWPDLSNRCCPSRSWALMSSRTNISCFDNASNLHCSAIKVFCSHQVMKCSPRVCVRAWNLYRSVFTDNTWVLSLLGVRNFLWTPAFALLRSPLPTFSSS